VKADKTMQRFDGNFTGYGYSLSKLPVTAAEFATTPAGRSIVSVWPAGWCLADKKLYVPVRDKLASLMDPCQDGFLNVYPADFRDRYETPLGHSATDTVDLRFHPLDLFDWNISSQEGLVSSAKVTSCDAIADRSRLYICRCDENIYRRITKLLCAPSGGALGSHWKNQFYVLSQWHGCKHMALLMFHTLYTPVYSAFFSSIWPEQTTLLRNTKFNILMQMNAALAKMINRGNGEWLLGMCVKHPTNKKLLYLKEFFLVALPQVKCMFFFGLEVLRVLPMHFRMIVPLQNSKSFDSLC